jgi:hypothetical protein
MSASKVSKASTLAFLQALMAGTKQHFPKGPINFGNATYTAASLIQLISSLVTAMTSLSTAQAAAKDAMANKQGIEAKVGPIVSDYKRFLLATFAGATQTLADFGVPPPKAKTPLSSAQKAAATAKAKATRQARGTVGSKKKLAIKGNVTGVTVTPVTTTSASAASSESAQPAPTAPSAAAPAATATK